MSEIRTPEPTLDEPLTIQHDPFPAEDHGEARRIPHLGHVAVLFGVIALSMLVSFALFALLTRGHPLLKENTVVQLTWEAFTYLLTLGISFRVFPLFWKRSFLSGIEWNALAARRNWPRLLSAGLVLCAASQFAERFISLPKDTEVDQVFSTQGGAWAAVFLGVILAPFCEEILFRGFLLPAFATAYDWLSLDRTPAGLERWKTSTAHTSGAKVFGALLSSLLFALLHAPQLKYAWGAVGIIFCVGMVLAYVRLRTHSLSCSTLVHMTYNGTIFAIMLALTHGFRHLDRLHQ